MWNDIMAITIFESVTSNGKSDSVNQCAFTWGTFLWILSNFILIWFETFVLQHATSSLPKFLHVPLGLGGWPLGYEELRCWSNCPCNYFLRFPTYVIIIHPRHRQRRTDRQTTCNRNTTFCTIVHRAVKNGALGFLKTVAQTRTSTRTTRRIG